MRTRLLTILGAVSLVALAAVGGFVVLSLAPAALASRNTAGSYALPAGNPVVSGTTISSTWANNTLSDIGTELTNSLDRNGRGAMLAPLQLSSGTSSAPGLTFSAEPTSGLYRAGSGDLRLQIASTTVDKWTGSAETISVPLAATSTATITGATATQAGLTATNSNTNGTGVTATGNGTGNGVGGTGGASSGAGLYGTGGAPNGNGVTAVGTGSGAGISSTGGSSGAGGVFTGGSTAGDGVYTTGGGAGSYAGVSAHGGAPNGYGIAATGAGTGAGGSFSNGTAATGATPQHAIVAQNGDIGLAGTPPNEAVGMFNAITTKNVIKAWATCSTNGSGGISCPSGYNVASASISGNNALINLATGMATGSTTTDVSIVVSPNAATATTAWIAYGSLSSASQVTIAGVDLGALTNLNLGSVSRTFTVQVVGLQ